MRLRRAHRPPRSASTAEHGAPALVELEVLAGEVKEIAQQIQQAVARLRAEEGTGESGD